MKTFDLEKLELKVGSHSSAKEGFCVMELVSYAANEPFSDSPQCVSPVIAAFLRSYNDSVNSEVRQSLKQYIPLLIGTRGSEKLEEKRSLIAADWLVRTHTPAWLRLAGLTVQAEALESLPEITSMAQVPLIKGPIEVARQDAAAARSAARDAARDAAWAAAGAAARSAAWDAARSAAWVAARSAARSAAWDAARSAAWAAAWDAAGAAARSAAWDAARDAAWAAARDAARDAAWDALKPTVDKLQATIPALIDRMILAKEDSE